MRTPGLDRLTEEVKSEIFTGTVSKHSCPLIRTLSDTQLEKLTEELYYVQKLDVQVPEGSIVEEYHDQLEDLKSSIGNVLETVWGSISTVLMNYTEPEIALVLIELWRMMEGEFEVAHAGYGPEDLPENQDWIDPRHYLRDLIDDIVTGRLIKECGVGLMRISTMEN